MISSLVQRDLRGRYKGSFLGFLWTFLNPLFQLIIYTFVFSNVLKAGIEKYYLFLFVALVPWMFFSACLAGGTGVVLSEKNLITKIYFPRTVLPIAFVTSHFINMLYGFIIVIIVVMFSDVKMNFLAFLYLPFVMFVEYMTALGVALIASSTTVYFRDLQQILGIVAMAWQFMTPVIYSISDVPESLRPIFMLNPMTPVIIAYREILYYGNIPQFGTLLYALVFSFFILTAGWHVFSVLQRRFAEEL
jgi:ABC-2 type transport system permease protein